MLDCVIIGEMQDDKRDKAGPCETGDKAEKHSDQLHLIVPGHNILDTQSVVLVEKTPTKVLLCPSPGTLLNNIGQKSSPDFRVLEDKNKLWSKKENTSSVPKLNAVSIASVTPVLSYSNFHEMVSADQVKEEDEIRKCLWLGCNHTFPCLSDLVNHVNDVHVKVEREVEYKCNWKDCLRKGRGFNARYKMLIHIRTHTTEKPHKCTICNKCFSRLENLKIHHRSHTGEKPYSCHFPGCSKAYSNSSDRFKHVRTHQVNKPYACKMPNCTKRYTDPSSLRKHVKTLGHHFRRAAFTGSMDDLSPNNSKHSHNDLSNGHVRNSDVHTPISPPVAILSTSTVTAHLISISSNQLSALASNPLLSSAIMPSTAITRKEVDSYNGPEAARESSLSLVESPTKELSAELPLLSEESQKLPDQVTPLDLSTGLINSNNADSVAEVCIGEDNADYSPKWELVSTD